MKSKIIIVITAVFGIVFTACKQEAEKTNAPVADNQQMEMKENTAMSPGNEVKTVAVVFNNVDPNASKVFSRAFNEYSQLKNALASDNANEATAKAASLLSELKKLDKSYLTAEQKKEYDKLEKPVLDFATAIAATGELDSQRKLFAVLSENTYELVKTFGAGQPVYYLHCPMAMDNKGAMWLSENAEVKNPFFGSQMLTCGSVREAIQ